MKKRYLLFLGLIIPIIVCSQNAGLARHMAMGSDTSEFYVKTYWHNFLTILLRSTNNGQSLSIQSTKTDGCEGDGYDIFGDATPGVVYMAPATNDSILLSVDYGITFTSKYFNGLYNPATGCIGGEFYIQQYPFLFRSTDYGNSFTFDTISNDLTELYDVGSLPGDLFFQYHGSPDTIDIAVSHDYGATFNVVVLPIQHVYQRYDLRRGPGIGEFYFICWHSGKLAFDLFHSSDYGVTLSFQGTSKFCGEMLTNCVAGRKPGTFYASRRPVYNDSLFIDYSSDYGVTYTTYAYCLDSTFTSLSHTEANCRMPLFPNPATDKLTVEIPNIMEGTTIELLNLQGQTRFRINHPKNTKRAQIDVSKLPRGIYFVRLTSGNRHVTTEKLVLR